VPFARIALYVATIGALALVARSLFIAPLSLPVAAAAFTAYVALVLCGVFFLRLGMFLDVVWRGPKGARGVALTFDDGPSPEHTPRILAMLDEAKVKAAFFVIARKAEAHPDVVRDIAARGHAIGLHSYGHDRLFSLRSLRFVREDLRRGMSALEAITGERPVMFRPPIGHSNPRIAKAADELGLVTVGWSVRALDGLARSRADSVAERVMSGLRHGAIVLLHDASERDDYEPASIKALPRILEAMRRRKLRGVPVSAWIPEAERAEPAVEESAP
jgi:peptidoglycan/xylan/chitin deacetylase (PgdA/CDA1 family)